MVYCTDNKLIVVLTMRENRIQIRFSDEELAELDVRSGGLSRSEYIRGMALGEQGVTGSIPVSKTEGSGSTPDVPASIGKSSIGEYGVSDVVEGKTPGGLDRCISDEDAVEMVESALEVSTRENWDTVKKVLRGEGYDWDVTTRKLKRGNLVLRRF